MIVARQIAAAVAVLLVRACSGVHGTAVGGQDDRNEMGLCLELRECVTDVSEAALHIEVVPRRTVHPISGVSQRDDVGHVPHSVITAT